MTAHIAFPSLALESKDRPFGLSRKAIHKWIRTEMNFDGIIISDDLVNMRAAHNLKRPLCDSVLLAADAGNDLILLGSYPARIQFRGGTKILDFGSKELKHIIETLEDYFSQPEGEEQLTRSVSRILKLKHQLYPSLIAADAIVNSDKAAQLTQTPEHFEKAEMIADAGVTLVNDTYNLIGSGKSVFANYSDSDKILLCVPVYRHDDLTPEIKEHRVLGINTMTLDYGVRDAKTFMADKKPELDRFLRNNEFKLVIFGMTTTGHAQLFECLLAERERRDLKFDVIAISYRTPNIISSDLISQITYLVVYSNLQIANQAIVRVLTGQVEPGARNKSPVSIPNFHKVRENLPLATKRVSAQPVRTTSSSKKQVFDNYLIGGSILLGTIFTVLCLVIILLRRFVSIPTLVPTDRKLESRMQILEVEISKLLHQVGTYDPDHHFANLDTEFRFALHYIYDDPKTTLTKCRVVTEALVLSLYLHKMNNKPPKKNELGYMLSHTEFKKQIPRRILTRLHSIRDMGNLGPHPGQVNADDARKIFSELCEFIEWWIAQNKVCK